MQNITENRKKKFLKEVTIADLGIKKGVYPCKINII